MNKYLKTNNLEEYKKIIYGLIILNLIFIGFIAYAYYNNQKIYKELTNEITNSYKEGYSKGINDWNNQVVNSVNQMNKIPYLENESIRYLPIKQICEGLK